MSNDIVIASLKEKIDALNQQAWEARINDSPKAFEISKESVKLARSINYSKGLAEGLRSLGFCYVRLIKNDEAAPLLRESLSLFQSLNDLKGQAVVYEYLGIIERNWGNLGHSLELLLKAKDLVRQVGPTEVEITIYYQIGVTYKHLGDHENALDYLYHALSLAKQTDLTLMEAYATNIIGSVYFDNGNYEQALALYQQGLVIRRQSNDKWGEAGSLDNIGFTYLKLNELDKATDYCNQSLAISQSTGDKKGEANALLHLAEIYEQAGDILQAAKFSNESLEIRKARGDKRGEAEGLLFLADLHKDRNDVEDHQIFEWISGALRIADEIKAQDLLSKAYHSLHVYHSRKGNYKESLVQLEAHLQIEKELHKNAINQKVSSLEISHKAEVISQRNKELTELNEQIEKANAELKIEASLERVRAVAMGMKKPADMLEVCKIISDQLEILDVKKIRNVQTAIFYEEKSSYMNYEYYAKHDKLLITEVDYNNHPVVEKFANQMLKGPNQVWTHGFKGEEVKDWLKYQRSTNVFIDTYLEIADSLNYYWYSLGPVALGMSTYVPLNENEIDLFKRFRNVFELAYRRYLDIEKALAQAREAKIEAALEKIRSRSLAMHKSDELREVVHSVFERLKELNIELYTAIIIVFKGNSRDSEFWLENRISQQYPGILVKYANYPHFKSLFEAKESGKEFLSAIYSFEEKNELFRYFFEQTDFKYTPEPQKKFILESEGMSVSIALTKNIGIQISSYSKKQFSEKENGILKRFTKVFDQAYTRFLDLQKAEAQGREAKIEAALEKVRSSTMAMQRSEDLSQTAFVLFNQFKELGQSPERIFIATFDDHDNGVVDLWGTDQGGKQLNKLFKVPVNEPTMVSKIVAAWKEKKRSVVVDLKGEELKTYLGFLKQAGIPVTEGILDDRRVQTAACFTNGVIGVTTSEPQSVEAVQLQERFAGVFDLTYTRFLDLQKAEAQAREAQIETALERVRSRSMGMQKSEELKEVIQVVYEQFVHLNINIEHTGFVVEYKPRGDWHFWIADRNGVPSQVTVPYFDSVWGIQFNEAKEKEKDFFATNLNFEEKNKFYNDLLKHIPGLPEEAKKFYFGCPGLGVSTVLLENVSLYIENFSGISYSDEENKTLMRFGKVFEQTYTRFLDLQKAETQAREAQIEAALEKVRSRSLAMHHSDELEHVVLTISERLSELGLSFDGTLIFIFEKETRNITLWISTNHLTAPLKVILPYDEEMKDNVIIKELWNAIKKGEHIINRSYTGKIKNDYFRYVGKNNISTIPDSVKQMQLELPDWSISFAAEKNSIVGIDSWSGKLTTDEEFQILIRFAKVFEQAYTRFLDLQKAEAQAREAKIEAALERARTQSMIMQHSKELDDTLRVFHEQVFLLGINSAFSFLWLPDEDKNRHIFWAAWAESIPANNGSTVFKSKAINYPLDRNEPATAQCLVDWKSDEPVHSYHVPPAEVENYFAVWKELIDGVEKLKPEYFRGGLYYVEAFMKYGCFGVMVENELSEDEKKILLRFSNEFERTYTRFLDLQKAEAQTREAQIEAALERVRSRTMAIHSSKELDSIIKTVYSELKKLDVSFELCFIMIFDEYKGATWWMGSPDDDLFHEGFYVPYHTHPPHLAYLQGWEERQQKWEYWLGGQIKKDWDDFLFTKTELSKLPPIVIQTMKSYDTAQLAASFENFGCMTVGGRQRLSEESFNILSRFAKVFDLSYTRFRDLQKAEAQTREALIEGALERVRARALAMQQPEELKDVAQVLRNEMGALGVEELETSSIYIHGDSSENVECWYALRDPKLTEKKMIADHFTLNLNDTWVGREMKKFYGSGEKQTSIVMQGANRREWIEYCYKHSPVFTGFYGETIPDRTYHLHKFSHGYIGAAAPGDISAESWKLLGRAASVFSLAYSRFKDLTQARNDLIKLKEEKKRAEDALTDLQAAQKQLIQAEKMASLGELTAGIAHEIQNPLNFVNNFSDVSNELLEEMKAELEKGNAEEAKAIAVDVKENLEKILHHGKRADAIVKGMLQHSRNSSGQKELTDINVLAEEYLRLAYHGLRAKDKFFNAKFETDLDPSINKINIVPQEIGRVILNLINNSFYAVSEKKKAPPPPEGGIRNSQDLYEPTVKVKTSLNPPSGGRGAEVVISVIDNGNGIPQKVLDKIFQPFFTTKPTGEGTGLGLSLSYDIITKGHDGEIKVETKEGEGSAFIISLPMK